jgi:hypothetical protein
MRTWKVYLLTDWSIVPTATVGKMLRRRASRSHGQGNVEMKMEIATRQNAQRKGEFSHKFYQNKMA